MADKITFTKELKLLAGFADEDDRTITISDPKVGLTSNEIHAFATVAAPVLIGDKYGAAFVRFKEAKYVNKTTCKIDLDNIN